MNKKKIFLFSLLATVVLFSVIIFAERKMVNYSPKVKAVYSVKDVKKKEPLKREDFVEKDVPITEVNKDTVKSLSEIEGMIAKDDIFANEILNKNRIANAQDTDNFNIKENERVMALSFQNISDVVGGTLRKDDIVDIKVATPPNPMNPQAMVNTAKVYQGIRILGAIDASGKMVEEPNIPATTLLIAIDPETGFEMDNYQQSSYKFKIYKVPN